MRRIALLVLLPSTLLAQRPVGDFDGHSDVGTVRTPGTVAYHTATQTYEVSGSGQNVWGDHDDFHYVWRRLTGDFILTARGRFQGAGVDPHRKMGWMIRASLDTRAPHVSAAVHGDGLASLQYRRQAGGQTEEAKSGVSAPEVIRLERQGGRVVMSVAKWGDTLSSVEVGDVALPDTVYVGLFVCAHRDTVVERATFENVRVTIPPRAGWTPYRDYIGSDLEILDVATGHAEVVHRYKGSFQAPNWTTDGRALIYNQEGKLYRFDLATRAPTEIPTAFATNNNNDHVLSFDGKRLAISHHAKDDDGRSNVYVVPTTGGTPSRVTERGPSYLHGWSPDGRTLLFVGERGGDYDVYAIPSKGGPERRLTSTPGLDDGPEYAPDGKWIWFNSKRTGRMQLWKMRPDGSGAVQAHESGTNDWFPHVSPDGKWVAYISFPPEVKPDDHPFYRRVTISVMPASGGPSRVVAYLFGGQGTMNVPSWSPDSKRLAFVSNTDHGGRQ